MKPLLASSRPYLMYAITLDVCSLHCKEIKILIE